MDFTNDTYANFGYAYVVYALFKLNHLQKLGFSKIQYDIWWISVNIIIINITAVYIWYVLYNGNIYNGMFINTFHWPIKILKSTNNLITMRVHTLNVLLFYWVKERYIWKFQVLNCFRHVDNKTRFEKTLDHTVLLRCCINRNIMWCGYMICCQQHLVMFFL